MISHFMRNTHTHYFIWGYGWNSVQKLNLKFNFKKNNSSKFYYQFGYM